MRLQTPCVRLAQSIKDLCPSHTVSSPSRSSSMRRPDDTNRRGGRAISGPPVRPSQSGSFFTDLPPPPLHPRQCHPNSAPFSCHLTPSTYIAGLAPPTSSLPSAPQDEYTTLDRWGSPTSCPLPPGQPTSSHPPVRPASASPTTRH